MREISPKFLLLLALLSAGAFLPGCGAGGGPDSSNSAVPPLPPPDNRARPGPAAGEQRAGVSYDITLTGFDGETIAFTVHEPETLVGGETYPLLLFGHGFGLRRIPAIGRDLPLSDQAGVGIAGLPLAFLQAGYGEISIDQRGFGDSTGSVRVLDPEVEGRYLVHIVDWAQVNLDWVAYREGNMLLGARGGSYGGGYQLLLNNVDPRRRLDAIVPEITWYDLNYSLNSGNVPKSAYASALSLASATGGSFLDEQFSTGLVEALANNRLSDSLQDELIYHSNRYFCEGIEQPGRAVDPTAPPRVDALFLQGSFDVLFNMNEALENYRCLSAAGGDVRMYTYAFGHVLPSGGSLILPPPLDATGPLFSCGSLDEFTLTLNWFNAKLKRDPEAMDFVNTLPEHCLVTDSASSAIALESIPVGGMATPAFDTTVLQGALAPPTGLPITLYTASENGEVIAGIPTATINIAPALPGGNADGDAIIFVSLARSRAGLPGNLEIIDDQVRPVRGLGEHSLELAGIAERLNAGDSVQLLLSGTALPQYPAIFSRDLTNPVVQVSGQVALPVLGVLPELP